jgi:hypothetical protein
MYPRPQYLMKVNDQFHALAVPTLEKHPHYPLDTRLVLPLATSYTSPNLQLKIIVYCVHICI